MGLSVTTLMMFLFWMICQLFYKIFPHFFVFFVVCFVFPLRASSQVAPEPTQTIARKPDPVKPATTPFTENRPPNINENDSHNNID